MVLRKVLNIGANLFRNSQLKNADSPQLVKVYKVGGKLINHETSFIRYPDLTARFPAFIQQKFPNGIPIEIFAASDGSTALATAIAFQEICPQEAGMYPICVSEKFPNLLIRARDGIVTIFDREGDALDRLKRDWNLLSVYNDSHDWSPVQAYIELTPLAGADLERYSYKRTWGERLRGDTPEQYLRIKAEVFEKLKSNLRFIDEPVDIATDLLNKIPDVYIKGSPRVIFFQSALYLLSPADRNAFYRAIQQLPLNSILVFGGDLDINCNGRNGLYGHDVKRALGDAGFIREPSGTLPYLVYEKCNRR